MAHHGSESQLEAQHHSWHIIPIPRDHCLRDYQLYTLRLISPPYSTATFSVQDFTIPCPRYSIFQHTSMSPPVCPGGCSQKSFFWIESPHFTLVSFPQNSLMTFCCHGVEACVQFQAQKSHHDCHRLAWKLQLWLCSSFISSLPTLLYLMSSESAPLFGKLLRILSWTHQASSVSIPHISGLKSSETSSDAHPNLNPGEFSFLCPPAVWLSFPIAFAKRALHCFHVCKAMSQLKRAILSIFSSVSDLHLLKYTHWMQTVQLECCLVMDNYLW